MTSSNRGRACSTALLTVAVVAISTTAFAQKITVKSATPSNAAQGTTNLDVLIDGSGFGGDSVAHFHVSGTTNPGGVQVIRTTRLSTSQVIANININDAALLSYYDVKVVSNGRTGKGTDLFQVIQKNGQAGCDAGTFRPASISETIVAAPPDAGCQVGASGALDCSFGTNGLVTTAVRPPYGFAVDLVGQPDGKVIALVYGYRPDTDQGFSTYLVRYDADGALDLTFGLGGVARFEFTSAIDWERPEGIALQSDGKILVAAKVPESRAAVVGVARFLTNGALDPSFGTGGVAKFSYGSGRADSLVQALKVQSDGRIVIGGGTSSQFAVARLTTTGVLDATFGSGGKVVTAVGQSANGNSLVHSLDFQLVDGQQYLILAGGSPACTSGPSRMAAVRLTPGGSVDTSFGAMGNGQVLVSLGDGSNNANAVLVDSSNRIVLGGTRASEGAVVRLAPNGLLDASFGSGGAARFVVADRSQAHVLRVTGDETGRLVVAGYVTPLDGLDWSFFVGRFLSSGQLDPSFGVGGVTITDFQIGNGHDWARGLVVQPGGRIVLAGVATPSLVGLAGYVP